MKALMSVVPAKGGGAGGGGAGGGLPARNGRSSRGMLPLMSAVPVGRGGWGRGSPGSCGVSAAVGGGTTGRRATGATGTTNGVASRGMSAPISMVPANEARLSISSGGCGGALGAAGVGAWRGASGSASLGGGSLSVIGCLATLAASSRKGSASALRKRGSRALGWPSSPFSAASRSFRRAPA